MKNAIEELNDGFFGDYSFLCCKSEKEYTLATLKLQKDSSEKIILLDLGFRDLTLHEKMWDTVTKNLTSLGKDISSGHVTLTFLPDDRKSSQTACLHLSSSNVDNGCVEVRTVSDSRLDGISLLGSIGGKLANSRTLVIIVSQLSPRDLTPILLAIQTSFAEKGWTNLRLEKDVDGLDPQRLDDAKALLSNAKTRWKILFPRLHPEPLTESLLGSWLEAYEGIPEASRKEFCIHGQGGELFTIQANPGFYQSLLQDALGLDVETCKAAVDQDLKAVFQMESHASGFLDSGSHAMGNGGKPISSVLVMSIIQKLSGNKVEYSGADQMCLPCQPGLPFFAALMVLFARMQGQDHGMMNRTTSISLHGATSGPNRISIPLRRREEFKWKIAKRWNAKIEDFPAQIAPEPSNKGGVCPALWDVLNARVRGIKFKEDSGNQEKRQLTEGKKQLLKVFDGPGRVVAGISFGPYCINIHW